jgi:hypothetical protein
MLVVYHLQPLRAAYVRRRSAGGAGSRQGGSQNGPEESLPD